MRIAIEMQQLGADMESATIVDWAKSVGDSVAKGETATVIDGPLRAGLLSWLCTDESARALIGHKGVRVLGAKIDGRLDLEGATIPFPIVLTFCTIEEGIDFRDAEVVRLELNFSKLGPVRASGLRSKSGVSFLNVKIAGQLDLPVATLDGKKIPRRVLDLVPYDYADDHTCLPLFLKEEEGMETLYVGMHDPSNLDVLDDLAFRTGMRVKPVVIAASEIC